MARYLYEIAEEEALGNGVYGGQVLTPGSSLLVDIFEMMAIFSLGPNFLDLGWDYLI